MTTIQVAEMKPSTAKFTSLKSIHWHYVLLIAIVLLALWLRLWGIGFGLPFVGYANDEKFVADGALEILKQNQINANYWHIGQAQFYLQALVGKIFFTVNSIEPINIPTYVELSSTKGIDPAHGIGLPYPVPGFYLWGRATVAILGALSVLVMYFIGTEIKSPLVGLISAFFLAGLSLHVEESHYLTRTVPGAFMLLLSFYIILLAYVRQKWSLYFLAFGLTYLAIYLKQNNLILLAPLGLALCLSTWREFRAGTAKKVGVVMLLGTIIFGLAWIILGFNIFGFAQYIFQRIFFNTYVFGGQHFGNSGNTLWWISDQVLVGARAHSRLIVFLALPGFLLAFQLKERGWLILALIVPYLIMLSFFTVRFTWWLMPPMLILVLLAALSLDWIYHRLGQTKLLSPWAVSLFFGLMIVLVAAASLRTAITLNYYASQPDVRNVASQWMHENLPAHSKVFIDAWGPYLDTEQYSVVYVTTIGVVDLQTYRQEQVDYLVLNSFSVANVLNAELDAREAGTALLMKDNLNQLMTTLPVEHEFVGSAMFSTPVVQVIIYKVP